MDEHGVNRTLWSGMTWQYWLATRKFKPAEYTFLGAGRDTPKHKMSYFAESSDPRGSVEGATASP